MSFSCENLKKNRMRKQNCEWEDKNFASSIQGWDMLLRFNLDKINIATFN